MTATSLDLSQIKTDALSSAATFRTLIGLGSSDAVTFKEATLASGTVASSTPVINATQTWNDGATTFTGILADITDTASASASLLMDLQVGGSSQFKFIKSGVLQFGSVTTANSIASLSNGSSLAVSGYLNLELQRASVTQLQVGNGALNVRYGTQLKFVGNDNFATNAFAALVADQLNGYVLAQRNGTNAQTFRLYNTYTSSTSFERLNVRWATNELIIDAEAGSGGGTLRGIKLGSATTSLLGFYGVTPVDQPLTVSDPTGGAIVDTEARTAIGEVIDRLQELGLIA